MAQAPGGGSLLSDPAFRGSIDPDGALGHMTRWGQTGKHSVLDHYFEGCLSMEDLDIEDATVGRWGLWAGEARRVCVWGPG